MTQQGPRPPTQSQRARAQETQGHPPITPEPLQYHYYTNLRERETLKTAVTRVCAFAREKGMRTVIALDRSGRHAGLFLRWAWQKLYPNDEPPRVFFMPPEYLADGIRAIVAPKKGQSPFSPLGYTEALQRVSDADSGEREISAGLREGYQQYRERIQPLLEGLRARHSYWDDRTPPGQPGRERRVRGYPAGDDPLYTALFPEGGNPEPVLLLDEYAEQGFESPVMWLKPFFRDLGVEAHAALLFYYADVPGRKGTGGPDYVDCIGVENAMPRWHLDVATDYSRGRNIPGVGSREGRALLGVQSSREAPVSYRDRAKGDRPFMNLTRDELRRIADELTPVN